MARSLWTGSISFGLVSIPIELHTAVRDHRPKFRLLHAKDQSPVKQELEMSKALGAGETPRKGEVVDPMERLRRSLDQADPKARPAKARAAKKKRSRHAA